MNEMTQSLEDYIEAIHVLLDDKGEACVHDIAAMLGVKMPSVVKALRELKKMGLATQEPYSPVELTPKGTALAAQVLERHTMLRLFLVKLGVSRKTADIDACRMEHILSAETLDRIAAFNKKHATRRKK